jgi:subtilisin
MILIILSAKRKANRASGAIVLVLPQQFAAGSSVDGDPRGRALFWVGSVRNNCVLVAVVVSAFGVSDAAAQDSAPSATVRARSEVRATIVRCWSGERGLASLLVPNGWLEPRTTLVVDGVTTIGDKWSAVTFATGEHDGAAMPLDAIRLDIASAQVSGSTAAIPIVIDRATLSSGHYTGFVRIAGEGLTTVEIPVDVKVRSGPLGALVWLLAGVVVGLGLKRWHLSGERMANSLAALAQWTTIIATESVANRELLEPLLRDADEAKYRGNVEQLEKIVVTLEARRAMLTTLDRLAIAVPAQHAEIARIRSMIARGRDTAAQEAIEALQRAVDIEPAPESVALPPPATARVPERIKIPWLTRVRLWLLQHVARRAVRVLAIAGAVLLGFKTLYVDSGDTYGANALFDGIALFVWGLGAEVSSRGLARLGELLTARSPRPPKEQAGDRLSLPDDVEIREEEVPEPESVPTTQWPGTALDLAELDKRDLKGDGVKIAVIDTGVAKTQKALDWARITSLQLDGSADGEDFHGHGTTMVALVASNRGVCPLPHVFSIRALDSNGTARAQDLVTAIDLAIAKQCNVISISVGQATADTQLSAAVQRARASGAVVVAAIRKENPGTSAYPARDVGVTSVTPSKRDGHLVYPNPPAWISIAAPGVEIPTYGRTTTATISGASAATAIVAGICARLLSAKPAAERAELARRLDEVLRSAATKVDGGRLLRALQAANKIGGN